MSCRLPPAFPWRSAETSCQHSPCGLHSPPAQPSPAQPTHPWLRSFSVLSSHSRTATALPSRHCVKMSSMAAAGGDVGKDMGTPDPPGWEVPGTTSTGASRPPPCPLLPHPCSSPGSRRQAELRAGARPAPKRRILGDSSGATATPRKPGQHSQAYHQAQLAPVPTALGGSEAGGAQQPQEGTLQIWCGNGAVAAQHPWHGILQPQDPPDPLVWAWHGTTLINWDPKASCTSLGSMGTPAQSQA